MCFVLRTPILLFYWFEYQGDVCNTYKYVFMMHIVLF